MKEVIETLQAARNLLAPKGAWVAGARNMKLDSGGYAHCALGALDAVTGKHHVSRDHKEGNYLGPCTPHLLALEAAIPPEVREAINAGSIKDPHNWNPPRESVCGRIACYNNTTDQKTVVEWFDRAIAIQREHPMEKA